uniref:Uncharacterized protein n=1 Tax=Poecilia latipinna TaxID=48699 RepID=A0A3B3U8C5_9TELE
MSLLTAIGGVVIMSPALLAWLGFTSAGVAAAMLQSAGAAGLGWFGFSFSALVGNTMGKIISTVCNVTVKNEL